ncbi:N-acetylmuramoyl-L-alanine amidase [Chloracidobacterium thermophilum]|uniref:N-acetylmuramoyl-L-alanine amidase n=1 Tax=Chloracidobacterium thermophilum (strain B) TaxID=981222 RepID=G2LI22_CHLTF|nr:N-acetylmuramoyl-L-alanine amidase [Chloracidobacterium thermophilum]AEP11238.1 N-acetylmuramoyl-L-alanine amidase [Chloracidobacterium thermophilum B]QUV79145.1 N-acetylmuramoyl-L-alanine amidase [Chloracidobacterium thermophilum]
MKRSLRLCYSLILSALLILLAPLREHQAHPQGMPTISAADELMHRAALLAQSLYGRPPAAREESEYLALVNVYTRAIALDTNAAAGDAALVARAELFREMAQLFNKPRYLYAALDSYDAVLRRYPDGPFIVRALVGVARIHERDLKTPEAAMQAYGEIIRRFPQSVSAREALACVARLQSTAGQRTPRDVAEAYSEDDAAGVTTISQVRHFSGPDYARVILDLSIGTAYERRVEGTSLVIRLPSARLSPLVTPVQSLAPASGMLRQVRLTSREGGVEVRIECTRLRDFAIFALDNPARLVADVRGAQPIAEEPTLLAESPVPSAGAVPGSLVRALGLKVKRIIIDPGHGGSDTGAIGRDGIYEKDVALDIALRLRAAIQRELKDVEVLLTRDTDRYVPLEERTAMANARQADLFISIHLNSSPTPLASGVETYFLSLDATKEELEVATRENATTSRSAGELQGLLQRIITDTRVAESRTFAQSIQSSLVAGLGRISPTAGFNRGVKKAPFVVLLGANMPSVLTEVSFLSHPKDGEALRTIEFRQSIAESLCDGIKRYIETLKRPGMVAAE